MIREYLVGPILYSKLLIFRVSPVSTGFLASWANCSLGVIARPDAWKSGESKRNALARPPPAMT